MVALLVDDEKRLLSSLSRAVQSVPEITETAAFDDEYEALEFANGNVVDNGGEFVLSFGSGPSAQMLFTLNWTEN